MEQTEQHPHHHPEQEEMPFAIVMGEPLATPPTDLYIPPDALEVFLDAFEGPLDLLLHLIDKVRIAALQLRLVVQGPVCRYVQTVAGVEAERMRGRKLLDVLEHAARRSNDAQAEVLVQRFRIQFGERRVECEQSLYFGREK